MKSKALIAAAAFAVAGAASAQGLQDARAAMEKTCAADIASLCAGKTGRDAAECLRAAGDKVSPACTTALAQGGGGGRGGAAGAQGGPGGRGGPGGPGAQGAARPPRAPPSEGGTVGLVDSVSASSFVVTMSSGQKATVELAASTTYRKGRGAASQSAITQGEPVLVLGIIQDVQGEHKTVIQANSVIAQPQGVTITPPAPGADGTLQRAAGGGRAAKQDVGQVPSFYKEGEGTIVGTEESNKAIVPALTAYPTGVVNRVVKLSDGSYEVHHVGVTWPHHIFIGADFKFNGAN